MKKLLFSLLCLSLYANTIQDVKNLYNEKKYKQAYTVALKLLNKNNYQSTILNFYFALSAEKIGNYKEALGAIERILIYEPNNTRAILEKAKIYYLLGNYNLAQQYFLKIKPFVNKQTNIIIDKYLKDIKKFIKTDFTNFSLMVGMGYDSNINNTTRIDSWNIYINNYPLLATRNQDIKSSFTINEAVGIKHLHKFDNSNLINTINIYTKQYTASHTKDIVAFQYSPQYNYYLNKYLLSTSLKYLNLNYGNNHYMSDYSLIQNIKYFNHTYTNNLQFKIENKIYEDNINNSTLYSIMDTISKLNKNSLFSLQFGIDMNRKHYNILSNISYNNYKAKITNTYFINDIKFSGAISYEYIKYLDFSDIFQKHQLDKKTSFILDIQKKLKSFVLQTNYTYIDNSSNIEPFDYNKWIINVNLIKNIKGLE